MRTDFGDKGVLCPIVMFQSADEYAHFLERKNAPFQRRTPSAPATSTRHALMNTSNDESALPSNLSRPTSKT